MRNLKPKPKIYIPKQSPVNDNTSGFGKGKGKGKNDFGKGFGKNNNFTNNNDNNNQPKQENSISNWGFVSGNNQENNNYNPFQDEFIPGKICHYLAIVKPNEIVPKTWKPRMNKGTNPENDPDWDPDLVIPTCYCKKSAIFKVARQTAATMGTIGNKNSNTPLLIPKVEKKPPKIWWKCKLDKCNFYQEAISVIQHDDGMDDIRKKCASSPIQPPGGVLQSSHSPVAAPPKRRTGGQFADNPPPKRRTGGQFASAASSSPSNMVPSSPANMNQNPPPAVVQPLVQPPLNLNLSLKRDLPEAPEGVHSTSPPLKRPIVDPLPPQQMQVKQQMSPQQLQLIEQKKLHHNQLNSAHAHEVMKRIFFLNGNNQTPIIDAETGQQTTEYHQIMKKIDNDLQNPLSDLSKFDPHRTGPSHGYNLDIILNTMSSQPNTPGNPTSIIFSRIQAEILAEINFRARPRCYCHILYPEKYTHKTQCFDGPRAAHQNTVFYAYRMAQIR